jgi:hypothetical protein
MSAIERAKQLKKEYEAAVKSVGQDGIKEVLAVLFEKFPEVQAVRWKQYTPYFNDGEPCHFNCQAGDCSISFGALKEDEDSDEYDDEDSTFTSSYNSQNYKVPAREAIFAAFGEALGAIEDDIYLAVFRDHVTVTADRNGFTVEEYEHD